MTCRPSSHLGRIVITRTVIAEISPKDIFIAVRRHAYADWGTSVRMISGQTTRHLTPTIACSPHICRPDRSSSGFSRNGIDL